MDAVSLLLGMKMSGSSGGGSSVPKPLTYDYMPEGYPKKSGWSVEWDGNTDGLISAGVFYKVSDIVPTDDELIGAILLSSTGRELKLTSGMITAISEDITAILDGEGGLVVRKDNAIFDDNTVLPQKGIYSMKFGDAFISKLSNQTITPMAEEFLPATVAEIKETANNAQTAAETAQNTANNAENIASAALPLSGGVIRISGGSQVATLTLDEFTGSSGVQKRGIKIGGSGAYGSPILEVTHDDITIYDSLAQRRIGGLNSEELFLKSKNSPKIFKITVDDSGTISATEVT